MGFFDKLGRWLLGLPLNPQPEDADPKRGQPEASASEKPEQSPTSGRPANQASTSSGQGNASAGQANATRGQSSGAGSSANAPGSPAHASGGQTSASATSGQATSNDGRPTVSGPARPAQTATASQTASPGRGQPAPKEPPTSERLELDAPQFAPLSDAEVKSQAIAMGGPGGPFFGRRDLIPPTSDPRTLLIDRAMVARGYLSPEELTEIHRVGDEMERIRPSLIGVGQKADALVAQVLEDRAERKRRKQAEAAQRKQDRRDAVAARRKTDIVFLGRGVSGGLADRQSDLQKLGAAGLPVLSTPADVAAALGLTVQRLRWLAFHSEVASRTHYIRFRVAKKSGGERELAAPHRTLAQVQTWILRNLLDRLPPSEAAQGFVKGRSTVTNARPHQGRDLVLNADLRDFFPTITFKRVRGALRRLGYSPAVATVLGLLCTESPRRSVVVGGKRYHVATGQRCLPQGAPTSPALSNLIARRLDSRLAGIAQKLGWTYTRYADDLTFSASGEAAGKAGYLLARLRHIAQDEGFTVNEKKTRLQRRNTAQSVTGLVVNQKPGVPREIRKRLRAILHQARRTGLAAQNRENRPHFEAWVRGLIAYILMVDRQQGLPLQEALTALDRKS